MSEHDWFYRVYEQQTDADVFGVFAPIVRLWQSKISDGKLPDWSEFGFDDFQGWYGLVSLGEIKPDYSEMIFLLWGTGLVELWDKDYTGKAMKEDTVPDHWETIEKPYVEATVNLKGIGVSGGTLDVVGRNFVDVTYVDLPVTRSGKEPYLMSVYQRDMDRTSLEKANPLYSYDEPYNPRI